MPHDGFKAQHRFVETADVSRAMLALLYQAAIDMLGTLPPGDLRRGIVSELQQHLEALLPMLRNQVLMRATDQEHERWLMLMDPQEAQRFLAGAGLDSRAA